MAELNCEKARHRLALGETAPAGELARHLSVCGSCRRFGELLGLLARDADVEPPPSLDRAVRTMLLGTPAPVTELLSPGMATGLALAALLALLSAVAGPLAAAGAAEEALPLTLALGSAYLALSAAAALPLLLSRGMLARRRLPGAEA